MKIAISASASFYEQVIQLSYVLEETGLEVVLPKTAAKIKAGEMDLKDIVSTWENNSSGYHGKALLIRAHFNEIAKNDVILVANYEKHGKENYIGPNVLMEMSTAFYLEKPIYILNGTPQESPLIDEILGVEPIFLNGDISKIKVQ